MPSSLLLFSLLVGLVGVVVGDPSPISRIVGGSEVPNPNPYPWVVELRVTCEKLNKQGVCGATALQNDVILTAAHCWYFECGDDDVEIEVLVGRNKASPDQIIRNGIVRRIHPDYHVTGFRDDIALFRLTGDKFRFEKYPMLANKPPASGTRVVAAGWGATKNDGPSVSVLREVGLFIRSDSACNFDVFDPASQICAGAPEKDTCQGDSGGPLFEITDCCDFPNVLNHGITSYGDECASGPAAYTQIEYYRDWIDETLDDWGITNKINSPTCCECDGLDGDIGDTIECVPTPSPPPTSSSSSALFLPVGALFLSFLLGLLSQH